MRVSILLMVVGAILVTIGCSAEEPTIQNCPTMQSQIQIKNDYQLLEAIASKFPSWKNKKKHQKLYIFVAITELNSNTSIEKNSVQIMTQNNRGIWLHELCHYFTNQMDASDQNEFAHEVIENIANGMSAETYRKYFQYNGGNGIYPDRTGVRRD